MKKCAVCKKAFEIRNSMQKYCSKDCLIIGNKKKIKKEKSAKKKVKLNKDKDWSYQVKERDNFRCVYCNSTLNLNSHHIYSRNNLTTRYDIDNGITLCAKHHTFSNEFSAHRTPVEFTYWLESIKGKEFLDNLRLKTKKLSYEMSELQK